MLINKKTIISLTLVLISATALADGTPPSCPSLSYPITSSLYAPSAMLPPGWTWLASTDAIDDTWHLGIALFLNDEPLRNMTEAQQIAYETPILQTATSSGSAKKIPWSYNNSDPSQGYFWACDYNVSSQYAKWDDTVAAFSETYYPGGKVTSTKHTLKEKIVRYAQVK